MSVTSPRDVEVTLRIASSSIKLATDRLRTVPQDDGDPDTWHERCYRDKAIVALADSLYFIDEYAKLQGIELVSSMPT